MIGRSPLHFQRWIESHRDRLRPPVGNQLVWEDAEFIIMVVGSNTRKDFHVNEGEEFFYQVEGDMTLKVQDDGKIVDVTVFLTSIERDFKRFNEVYREFFGGVEPCRTTVEVNRLPTPIHVELKVIATIG